MYLYLFTSTGWKFICTMCSTGLAQMHIHESIKLHIAWFAGRDVAKHIAQGNIDWLTGSDVRKKSNFA